MPNRAQICINNDLKVLLFFLEKSTNIIYRKKLSGFGCNLTNFDYPDKKLTKKIFRTRRDEFVNKKLIIPIKGKKSNSTYYSITPIGICYLFQNSDIITKNEIKKAFSFFRHYFNLSESAMIDFYYEIFAKEAGVKKEIFMESNEIETYHSTFDNKYGSENEILELVSSKNHEQFTFKSMKQACETIILKQTEQSVSIELTLPLPENSKIMIKRFTVEDDKVFMYNMEYSKISYLNAETITEQKLFQVISEHIVDMFYYLLLHFCYSEREELRKLSFENNITQEQHEKRFNIVCEIERSIPRKIFERCFGFQVVLEKAIDVHLARAKDIDDYLLLHLPEIRKRIRGK